MPKCGGRADVYSRIAGYYRPVHDWNEGKHRSLKNRIMYRMLILSSGTKFSIMHIQELIAYDIVQT